MARLAWLTPNTGDGTTVARCLIVPVELQPMVNGALDALCDDWNWQQDGDMTINDAITALRAAIDAYYESECDMTTPMPNEAFIFWREGTPTVGNALQTGISASQSFNQSWRQNAPAINDVMKFEALLVEGTYDLTLHGVKNSQSGIVHVFIDGAEDDQTIDLYAAAGTNDIEVTTSVVIPTSGVHTLEFKVSSKNGASSNYQANVTFIKLIRTGD